MIEYRGSNNVYNPDNPSKPCAEEREEEIARDESVSVNRVLYILVACCVVLYVNIGICGYYYAGLIILTTLITLLILTKP